MQIFDLPTELAQLAFDHIVRSRSIRRVIRIRIVNRQFKAYIDDSIFRLGLFRDLDLWITNTIDREIRNRRVHQASISYICSYISYRALRDHSTISLLGRVRQAAKTLCENDGNTGTEAITACTNSLILLVLEYMDLYSMLKEPEIVSLTSFDNLEADIYVAAIYLGKKSYVERLLAVAGRPGVCSTIFGSDFHAAAMRGNLDIIKLLLSCIAEYRQKGVLSESQQHELLWCASRYGHEAAFDFALDKRTIIHTRRSDISMLEDIIREVLIPKNFERAARIIGSRDESWVVSQSYAPDRLTNCLQCSARKGHVQMVRYFLDKGVKPNYTTRRSKDSPLFSAIRAGNETIVRMLLDAGADPNLPGPDYTALGYAVRKGSESIVKLFLSRSADINEGSPPPIVIAVSKENMEMFRLLRGNGARLDTPKTGRNYLKLVKDSGLSSMVDVLVSEGIEQDDVLLESREEVSS